MKLLAVLLAFVFGVIGAGTLLERTHYASATPAPSTPAALTIATPQPSPGAWMWTKQARTALDRPATKTQRGAYGSNAHGSSYSPNAPGTTWSPSPGSSSGEWIEHDSRVSAMQAVGGGSSRR